jgi:hypothetical protein
VDSSYFRNIKELIVFMKEPAKNKKLERWFFQKKLRTKVLLPKLVFEMFFIPVWLVDIYLG